ncbi:GntR family transcriptional regulator [Kineosporia sp. R_H_3]|uniref:GntR family transcriptional regulator n=1 Tax=Kineosporia sp. R_H_3 TaxID=1961848 RepID=UPI000B4B2E6A|nr:GntR family transcriptional regulator [Kineosporia sp. R_H_3]
MTNLEARRHPTGEDGDVPDDLNASERVAAALAADILDGALPPGSRMREVALADRFDVGRYTVRSAIALLTARGLLVHERHRGAFVPELTRERVDEVHGFRRVIEIGSLRLALARGADLGLVDDAVRELEQLGEDAPWRTLIATHQDIHHQIVAAAGNERLLSAYATCELELQLMFAAIRPDFTARRLAVLHRHLLDQLYIGGDVAVRALEDDLEISGRAALLSALERQTPA